MIQMALIALAGVAALLLLTTFSVNRHRTSLAFVRRILEEEFAAKLKRDADLNQHVVRQISDGIPVDQCIASYQRDRASIVPSNSAESPWNWSENDVTQWKKEEWRRRADEAGRRMIVPTATACVFVIAVTVSVLAVVYDRVAALSAVVAGHQADEVVPQLPPLVSPAATSPSDSQSPTTSSSPDSVANGSTTSP